MNHMPQRIYVHPRFANDGGLVRGVWVGEPDDHFHLAYMRGDIVDSLVSAATAAYEYLDADPQDAVAVPRDDVLAELRAAIEKTRE